MMRTIGCVLLLMFSTICGVFAEKIGDVHLETLDVESGDTQGGYIDARYLISNSSDKERTVELVLRTTSGGYGEIRKISRTVVLPPKSQARVSLPVPYLDAYLELDCYVKETGKAKRGMGPAVTLDAGSSPYSYNPDKVNILVLGNLYAADVSGVVGSSSRTGSDISAIEWNESDKLLTRMWQGFARYDMICVDANSFAGFQEVTQETLMDFVCSGGHLVIFGADNLKVPGFDTSLSASTSPMDRYNVGFGEVAITSARSAKEMVARQQSSLESILSRGESFKDDVTEDLLGVVSDSSSLDVRFPVSGTFLLMLVYVIVCGPVLLLVVRKLNRRIWLNWAIPLLSLITTLGIVVYAALAEGKDLLVRSQGLTLLDQGARRAVTIGFAEFYSPRSFSGDLRFESEWEVIAKPRGSSSASREVDWTDGQRLTKGWVRTRLPESFVVRATQPARERLAVKSLEDGRVEIVNGLGAPVEQLLLVMPNRDVFELKNLNAGERRVLDSASSRRIRAFEGVNPSGLIDKLGSTADVFGAVDAKPHYYLRPGSYVARLSGAPFVPSGHEGKAVRTESSVVIGILGGEANEG